MPLSGAIFVTQNPRRRKHAKKRNKRKASARRRNASVLFGVNRKRSHKRRRVTKRRRNAPVLFGTNRRHKRRRNALALRTNRKRRSNKRRRNGLALRTNRRSHKRRRNALALKVNRRSHKRRRNALALRTNKRRARRNPEYSLYRNALALRTNKRRARRNPEYSLYRNKRHARGRRKNAEYKLYSNKRHVKRRRNAWVAPWDASPLISLGLAGATVNRRRRNSAASSDLPFVGQIQKLVAMVPVVGHPVAAYVAPAALGAISLGGTYLVMTKALPMVLGYMPAQVQEAAAKVQQVTAPVAYTLGGAVFGLVVGVLPVLDKRTKVALASGAVVAGAGVDMLRYLTGSDLGVSAPMGDGGLWELGADPDLDRVMAHYSDANLGDANFSGHDLDEAEGRAAIAGPRAWMSRFPGVLTRTHVQGGTSPHAGRHGHRWGWLIALVGFDKFRVIAQMRPSARQAYLKQLSEYARSSVPAASSGPLLTDTAVVPSEPLGALLYAGSV